MKVVILAGGLGTRISEESVLKPKPMIEIGGKPILWHIMKLYSYYGYNDFIICCGYKGYVIKEYFANYFLHMTDVTFDMVHNEMHVLNEKAEPWKVTLIDTGLNTMTGGRLKRIEKYIDSEKFMVTYGDGVSNVNIDELVKFHEQSGRIATMTAVQPSGRFGAIEFNDDFSVALFKEKPRGDGAWINGGFFIFSKDVFRYIDGDDTVFEKKPLENLACDNQLVAYKHSGYWKPMDTLRDKLDLENQWSSGNAEWMVWN